MRSLRFTLRVHSRTCRALGGVTLLFWSCVPAVPSAQPLEFEVLGSWSGTVHGLAAFENTVYVVAGIPSVLTALDAADPSNISEQGSLRLPAYYDQIRVAESDGQRWGYLVPPLPGPIATVELTDPKSMGLTYAWPQSFRFVTVDLPYLYALDTMRFHIFDVSWATNPALLSSTSVGVGFPIWANHLARFDFAGSTSCVGDHCFYGVRSFDASQPTSPSFAASIELRTVGPIEGPSPEHLIAFENHLWVFVGGWLDVYRYSVDADPVLERSVVLSKSLVDMNDFEVEGNTLFYTTAAVAPALRAADISDPALIRELAVEPIVGLQGLGRSGETIYAFRADGFDALVLRDSTTPVFLSDFRAATVGHGITLTWSLTDDSGVDGFWMHRSGGPNAGVRVLNEQLLAREIRHYVDQTARRGEVYTYTLAMVSSLGETRSAPLEASLAPAPALLLRNRPNPFNPTTSIEFMIDREAVVNITIYDVSGKLVATLVDQKMRAGTYSRTWGGRDGHGNPVASGSYAYRLTVDGNALMRKAVLLR